MTLAIDPRLAVADDPRAATLTITGATGVLPIGSPLYESDYAAGDDGWTEGGGATIVGGLPDGLGSTPLNVNIGDPDTDSADYGLTGLTGGQFYRVTALHGGGGEVTTKLGHLRIAAGEQGDYVAAAGNDQEPMTLLFTASGATATLMYELASAGAATIRDVVVQRVSSLDGSLTVLRTDANGTRYVRLPEDASPDASGDLVLVDEEFALAGTVTYVVRDADGNLASADLVNTGGGPYTLAGVVLAPVGYPGQGVLPAYVYTYDQERDYAIGANPVTVIGRADPVVITRQDQAWSLRQGTLSYRCADYAAVQLLELTYQAGRVALLRTADQAFADLYHVPASVTARPETLRRDGWTWTVEVRYQEVTWPDGQLQGTGWTWDDLAGQFVAWYQLPVAYATWADVLAGP